MVEIAAESDAERVAILRARELAARHRLALQHALSEGDLRFPRGPLDELIAADALLLWVPRAYGGAGVSLAGFCAITEELASGWPAVGLLLVMPPGVASMYLYPDDHVPAEYRGAWCEQSAWTFGQIAAGRVFAAGNSEPGISDINLSRAVARREGDGWRISGRKVFGSWGQHSDWFQTTARVPDDANPDGRAEQFFVATNSQGVHWNHDWNGLGMAETESHSFVLEDAASPWMMGYPGVRDAPLPAGWAALPFAAVALGCVRGLLAPMLAGCGGLGPALRSELATLTARYEAARAYLRHTAAQAGPTTTPAFNALVMRTKAQVTREAVAVASELFALGSGQALAANGLAGKYLRDVFAGTGLRPPLRAALETQAVDLERWEPPLM